MGTNKKIKSAFPDILSDLIANSGKTLREIAKESGVGISQLSAYQSGKNEPNMGPLVKLSNYFDVSLDWLVGCPNNTMSDEEQILNACKYTGLSFEAVNTLHNLHTAHSKGLISKGFEIYYVSLLSDILEMPNDFFRLFDEIAFYMVYGGALPDEAYAASESELSVEEWERFHRWANSHKQEIVSRDEARELHLQLAGEQLKGICRNILEKVLTGKKKVENDGKH